MKLISLFSGCGGLDEGFVQAGFDVGAAYEIDLAAARSYSRNLGLLSARPGCGARVYEEDLSKIDPKRIATQWMLNETRAPVGVIGGPPCQAFSRGNSRRRDDDPRAEMVHHYGEILSALAEAFPLKFFVLENVPQLTHQRHRPLLDDFEKLARTAGFSVSQHILDAQYFGVPQRRARVFVIGIHKEAGVGEFKAPTGSILTRPLTVRETIEQLPEPTLHNRGIIPEDSWIHPNHWAPAPRSHKFADGALLEEGRIKGRSFRVLRWDEPSWAVAYGHREVHVHPTGRRRLSIFEALLLQGFPKEYVLEGSISQQIAQVSEAVPPPLAKAVADAILEHLQLSLTTVEENSQPETNGHLEHSGLRGLQTSSPKSIIE